MASINLDPNFQEKKNLIFNSSKLVITDSNVNLYDKIVEGKAQCYFHKTKNEVFYNPIQEFNRDLSISIINTYSIINENKKIKILEALAASGIRSMRYALEIQNCKEIIANDLDKRAVELIDANIVLNEVSHLVKSNCDDAIILMNTNSKYKNDLFDCIDLDPYGSPSAFLDSSIRTIKSGGLLLVTATDAGVLCGNGADSCYTKYGALSIRTPCCHELALRILLQSINSHAVRYSKYIVPLMSLSIDFYFRVFVLVYDGQMKAKESINNIGLVNLCSDCHSFYPHNFGKTIPTKKNVKFIFNNNNLNLTRCLICNGSLKMCGPLWLGSLHDKNFAKKVIEYVNAKNQTDFKTIDRMLGMLNLVFEELDEPFYYVLDDLCSVFHCEMPNHKIFRSAILNAGFQVSYSHCNKNSIKTNAPHEVIWNIMKKWIENKPIKEKWLGPEFKTSYIIKNLPQIDNIDLTLRQDCLPNSKREKLVRFHDPPPFWGPRTRPKRKAEEEQGVTDSYEKKVDTKNDSKNTLF